MRPTRTALIAGLAVMILGVALAASGQSGGVVVTSVPPGAVVELRGDHVLRGVTPWRVDRGIAGEYAITARKLGYEDWHGNTVLSATRRDSIFIRLDRKTVLGSALRSALVPGWGQFHTRQNVKGTTFLLAEVAAVGAVLWADAERNDAESVYEKAQAAYEKADQIDEIEQRYDEMMDAYDEFREKHLLRRRLAYIAGIIYLANLADAIFLYPEPGVGTYAAAPDHPGFHARVEPDAVSVGLVIPF